MYSQTKFIILRKTVLKRAVIYDRTWIGLWLKLFLNVLTQNKTVCEIAFLMLFFFNRDTMTSPMSSHNQCNTSYKKLSASANSSWPIKYLFSVCNIHSRNSCNSFTGVYLCLFSFFHSFIYFTRSPGYGLLTSLEIRSSH